MALFSHLITQAKTAGERTAPLADWLQTQASPETFTPRGQLAGVNRFTNGIPHIKKIIKYAGAKTW